MTDIIWFKDCSNDIKHLVGSKCAYLGELFNIADTCNFYISNGFAISTKLFDDFICNNNIDSHIKVVDSMDVRDISLLETQSNIIRSSIMNGVFSACQTENILKSCTVLKGDKEDASFAIRSSAIAEDLPNASFAGLMDTYLNIQNEENILESIKKCFASLFNVRAISNRKSHNIPSDQTKIAVACQLMIRSDLGSAGVAFSLDTDSGYNKAIIINSAFVLGEIVVSGSVKPDEFIVDKRVLQLSQQQQLIDPILSKSKGDKTHKIVYSSIGTDQIEYGNQELSLVDEQIKTLATIVLKLETYYSNKYEKQCAVDVEWALDGIDQRIYILQMRPETIFSNPESLCHSQKYFLKQRSETILSGVAVGSKISCGRINILRDMSESHKFVPGDIIVTDLTTPDWEPLLKLSSGIITNKGGRTCHASIIARELGINALVGAKNATTALKDNEVVTINCSDGETGYIHKGQLAFEIQTIKYDFSKTKLPPIEILLWGGNPSNCFQQSLLPLYHKGLLFLETIVGNIHPLAYSNYPNIPQRIKDKIDSYRGNLDSLSYYIQRKGRHIGKIASAMYPKPLFVRLSDLRSNEFKHLLGGELYEPLETNPMIGLRGAAKLISSDFEEVLNIECKTLEYAIKTMQMDNINILIPFCRTPNECKTIIDRLSLYGLDRSCLKIYLFCEVPSNILEADIFAQYVDGVFIGCNDLMQLTIGVDRDTSTLNHLIDHTNLSFRRMLKMAIDNFHRLGKKVGICSPLLESYEFLKYIVDIDADTILAMTPIYLKVLDNLNRICINECS